MKLRNTPTSFGLIHKGFHWIMAIIILVMLSVGFFMTELEFSPFKLEVYALHKSFGVLVLMLLTGRILWRLFDRRPKHVPTLKWWENALAMLVHFALYFAIFSMCMYACKARLLWLLGCSSRGGARQGTRRISFIEPQASGVRPPWPTGAWTPAGVIRSGLRAGSGA